MVIIRPIINVTQEKMQEIVDSINKQYENSDFIVIPAYCEVLYSDEEDAKWNPTSPPAVIPNNIDDKLFTKLPNGDKFYLN